MKILILNWRDTQCPLSGGAEIALFEHAKYWSRMGAQVIWFSSSYKGARKEEEISGVRFIRKGSHYTVHLFALIYYLLGKFGSPEVIVDCFHFIPFFVPLYTKKMKIIALIHEIAKESWYKNIIFPLSFIGKLLEPYFFRIYRKIQFITVSNSVALELAEFGIPRNHINVIANGANVVKLNKRLVKKKYPLMVYLAQISPDKGIEDAIKAFSIVKRKSTNAKFWVIGKSVDSRYLAKVKNLVKYLELERSVIFYGYVSEERKFELLAEAWILIHPSIREGWGLNVIEANSVGTPAVGYNIPGLKDSIINQQTGVLVERGPENLAKVIIDLINRGERYNILSKKAVAWAGNFSWEESGKKSWKILNN